MTYPNGYGAAEHRRALDAMLADIARLDKGRKQRRASGRASEASPRVLGSSCAAGQCRLELLVNPELVARA